MDLRRAKIGPAKRWSSTEEIRKWERAPQTLVLDASVAAKSILDEEDTESAITLRDARLALRSHNWIVPLRPDQGTLSRQAL
jgi:hypothetical protein